jgi:hypothetical protein
VTTTVLIKKAVKQGVLWCFCCSASFLTSYTATIVV